MDKYPMKQKPIVGKPIVHYRTDVDFYVRIGQGAVVHPVDHHDTNRVSNTKHVRTSQVIAFNPIEGGFETANTIYRPFKGEFKNDNCN